jgi:anti-anti-sigma factor
MRLNHQVRTEVPSTVNRGSKRRTHNAKRHGQPLAASHRRADVRVRLESGFTIVEVVENEILFAEDVIRRLDKQILSIARRGPVRLLLNLSSVRYMSCAFVKKLAGLKRAIERKHGRLLVCSLDAVLSDTLKIGRFRGMFDSVADESEALGRLTTLSPDRGSEPVGQESIT